MLADHICITNLLSGTSGAPEISITYVTWLLGLPHTSWTPRQVISGEVQWDLDRARSYSRCRSMLGPESCDSRETVKTCEWRCLETSGQREVGDSAGSLTEYANAGQSGIRSCR